MNRQDSMTDTKHTVDNKKDPQKKNNFGTVSKKNTVDNKKDPHKKRKDHGTVIKKSFLLEGLN